MSILLCLLCLNLGVALGMLLAGILREQRDALDGGHARSAEAD